jgi:hypothetical protein
VGARATNAKKAEVYRRIDQNYRFCIYDSGEPGTWVQQVRRLRGLVPPGFHQPRIKGRSRNRQGCIVRIDWPGAAIRQPRGH